VKPAEDKERRDAAYLEEIRALSFEGVVWTPDRIVQTIHFLSPWNHNIRLPGGIYTAFCPDYYPAHREMMSVINQELGGEFAGKRVIDIGCLEGYFAVECASQGARVIAVDGKLLNLRKCEFVRSVLGLDNLTLARDDALQVTRARYGGFDGVLALGLLYHLADPFTFLVHLAELCDGFLLLDTRVAPLKHRRRARGWPILSELTEFSFGQRSYAGRRYQEYEPGTTQVSKDLSPAAALTDEWAVWLTEDSLVRMLHDVGFEDVSKKMFAAGEKTWWSSEERVLMVARRTRRGWRSKVFPAA
jgi:SAM-dependent methyltransferase